MHALFAFSTYLLVHLYVSCLFRLFKDLHYAKPKREPANEERYNWPVPENRHGFGMNGGKGGDFRERALLAAKRSVARK